MRSNLIVAMSAAAVLAVVGAATYLVDIADIPRPSESVQPAESSPALPTPPPHRKVMLFNLVELPYLNEWRGAMNDPGRVENIVDGTHCALSSAMCPHIMIHNMKDEKAVPIKADQCPATLEPASGELRQLSDATVDGVAVNRYEQELCPMGDTGAPSVIRHTWDVPGKLRIVATDTTAPLALDDLKAAIANIKWLD